MLKNLLVLIAFNKAYEINKLEYALNYVMLTVSRVIKRFGFVGQTAKNGKYK